MLGLSSLYSFGHIQQNVTSAQYFQKFGYVIGGITTHTFMRSVQKLCEQENYTHVAFVARDGFSLQKIFNVIVRGSVETSYVYAPRIMSAVNRLDFDNFKSYSYGGKDLIRILNYYAKDLNMPVKQYSISEALEALKLASPTLVPLIKRNLHVYRQYLQERIPDEHSLVVDTMAAGFSAQNLIQVSLDREQKFAYWGTHATF